MQETNMDFEILLCNLLIMISSTGPVWSHYTSAKPAKSVQSVNKFAQELLRNFEACINILIVKFLMNFDVMAVEQGYTLRQKFPKS